MQPSDISEKAVIDRLNYKVDSIVKNKSISKIECENIKLKNEIEQLKKENKVLTDEKNRFKSNAEYYMKQSINKSDNEIFIKLQNLNIEIFLENYLPLLQLDILITKHFFKKK